MSDIENEEGSIAETVAEMTGISIPIYALRGALGCVADADAMKHMSGVYIHQVDGNLRVAASDGHRLFVASFEYGGLPDWCGDGGVIIPGDELKPRLGLLSTLKNTTAMVSFAKGASHVKLSDATDSVIFRLSPIDATFPDYETGVVEKALGAFSREAGDFQPVGYSASYLKDVGAMAKLLASDYVRVYSTTAQEPSVVVFDQAPGVVLYLMPSKVDSPLAPQTAKLLEGPIKGTIAALRAHQTRWEQKLDQLPADAGENERGAIEDKIAEYRMRIENVVAKANPPALPSPLESFVTSIRVALSNEGLRTVGPDNGVIAVYEGDQLLLADLPAGDWCAEKVDPAEIVSEIMGRIEDLRAEAEANAVSPRQAMIDERSSLSLKKRKTAARDFLKDVRLALVAGGWTGDLANAGEAEAVFADGYTVNEFVSIITGREMASTVIDGAPGSADAYMAEIDRLLAEKQLRTKDLLEDTPFAEWFEAGLSPQEALDRGLDAWLRPASEREGFDPPELAATLEVDDRPDNVGGFIDAVMAGASPDLTNNKKWRRKITAAATEGFANGKSVSEVVALFATETAAAEQPTEEPQLEAAE